MNGKSYIPNKIISGGQTGVDRAALDTALELGIAIGGWCPKGRKSEGGAIPDKYPLTETPKSYSLQRTEWNIRDSDATLILNMGDLEGGTKRTLELAHKLDKPALVVQLDQTYTIENIRSWLIKNKVESLNIAGPRSSKQPHIYMQTRRLCQELFRNQSGLNSTNHSFYGHNSQQKPRQ